MGEKCWSTKLNRSWIPALLAAKQDDSGGLNGPARLPGKKFAWLQCNGPHSDLFV
jgi:hypothetical protein